MLTGRTLLLGSMNICEKHWSCLASPGAAAQALFPISAGLQLSSRVAPQGCKASCCIFHYKHTTLLSAQIAEWYVHKGMLKGNCNILRPDISLLEMSIDHCSLQILRQQIQKFKLCFQTIVMTIHQPSKKCKKSRLTKRYSSISCVH